MTAGSGRGARPRHAALAIGIRLAIARCGVVVAEIAGAGGSAEASASTPFSKNSLRFVGTSVGEITKRSKHGCCGRSVKFHRARVAHRERARLTASRAEGHPRMDATAVRVLR